MIGQEVHSWNDTRDFLWLMKGKKTSGDDTVQKIPGALKAGVEVTIDAIRMSPHRCEVESLHLFIRRLANDTDERPT